ncbi:MAG: RuvX/YqgF family protein, partial [bacterium]|nr:RuvX/YqgF family protein [bacterium]
RKRTGVVDRLAAVLLLENYLAWRAFHHEEPV